MNHFTDNTVDNQLQITKVTCKEELPYQLLYLADESDEGVADYINRSECYVGRLNGEVIGEYVLLRTRPFTVELVNVAVDEKWQGKGYGKQLVKHAIATARSHNYKVIEVGTGDAGIGQLALYQKCGFTMCGIDYDFFSKHCKEPIIENGILLRHMVRLRIDL